MRSKRSPGLLADLTVLGRDGADIVSSGDAIADASARNRVIEAYDTTHQVVMEGADKAVLIVGREDWPFPIPLVRKDGTWRFDTAAGRDVMRLLRAQQVEAGEVVARRGEPAHSMYFVAAGEVEIELRHQRVRLGAGHFFGEIATLRRTRRSATITAVTRASLLVLDAHDLHALMDREPRIAERIREVARGRVGREVLTSKGDLITEELNDDATSDAEAIEHG